MKDFFKRGLFSSHSLPIFLIILNSLFIADCGGKKKKMFPFWISALTGGQSGGSGNSVSGTGTSSSSTSTSTDSNGVVLPPASSSTGSGTSGSTSSGGSSSQEVSTSGAAIITGSIIVDTSSCPSEVTANCGVDLTNRTVSLVDANGNVIATTSPDANGNFSFNVPNMQNGNYRVLINSENGLNYAYNDFNFTFNPTVPGANQISVPPLQASRLYYNNGPAQITGNVTTPGFKDQSGLQIVPAGGLSGVTVRLVDSTGTLIATTTTGIGGAYTFNVPNLNNGNYTVVAMGSALSSNNQPFSDVSSPFRFTFSGSNPVTPTSVAANLTSAWIPASSATANISNWSITNAANNLVDKSGFTVTLKDASGNIIATTSTNSSGQFSFSPKLLSGVYSVEVSRTGYITTSTAFSFTANPDGSATSVSRGATDPGSATNPIAIVPRPSNVTGTVSGPGNTPPRIPGSVINFRPDTTQSPIYLYYLSQGTDDRLRNLANNWIREACAANSGCNTTCAPQAYVASCVVTYAQTNPSWNSFTYTTYANKVYEVSADNVGVFFTAVPGTWQYYISAAGYQNSSVSSITLNGQDVGPINTSLLSSTNRSSISGNVIVLDSLVSGTGTGGIDNRSYQGTVSGYTNAGSSLQGLFVVMLGNTTDTGTSVAHVTMTDSSGNFSFNGSSRVISLPTSLTSDDQRVAYAIQNFASGALLSSNPAGIVSTSNSSTLPVYNNTGGSTYQFRQGSYNVIVVDPLGHLSASSTRADNSSVASGTNTASYSMTGANVVRVLHLPRREIQGNVSDAITTGSLSGVTVTLISDTTTNRANPPAISDVRMDCLVINFGSCTAGSRAGSSTADQLVAPVTTDASGNFRITNIDPGSYLLSVSRNGYVNTIIPVVVPSTGGAVVVNPQIVQDGPRGGISGRVVIAGGSPFTGTYTLEVVNPIVGTRPTAPVAPASLTSGTTVFTNTPNYSIFSVNPGQWKIKFAAAGYVSVEGLVTVQPNATANFDIVTMIPGSQAPASISGRLLNALNNAAITTSLSVSIRPGIGVTTGPYALDANNQQIQPINSASDGSYVIPNVPAGNYTIQVSGTGFITTYQTVISAGSNSGNQNILVSPSLATDEVRIVLAWNSTPRDLDSHLEYGSAYPSQVVWNDKCQLPDTNVRSPGACSATNDLTLDIDITTGYGPETVTLKGSAWTQSRRGYSVYNWSNEAAMNISGATVKVFRQSGLVRSYSIPSGQISRWWPIFSLNSDKTIVDAGQTDCAVNSYFNSPQN